MSDTAEALIAFLNARLDEKEAAAKAALHGGSGCWVRSGNGDLVDADREEMMWVIPAGKTTDAELAHIGLNDPGHALREVKAARAILADYGEYKDAQYPDFDGGYASGTEDAIKHLAAVDSGHPDYRQEWAP